MKCMLIVVSLTRLCAGCILVLRSDTQLFYRDVTRQTSNYTSWGAFRCLVHSNWCNSNWFCHNDNPGYLPAVLYFCGHKLDHENSCSHHWWWVIVSPPIVAASYKVIARCTCWYFLTFTDKIRKRTEDTVVTLQPESIQVSYFHRD